jgi:hypothetical protein
MANKVELFNAKTFAFHSPQDFPDDFTDLVRVDDRIGDVPSTIVRRPINHEDVVVASPYV